MLSAFVNGLTVFSYREKNALNLFKCKSSNTLRELFRSNFANFDIAETQKNATLKNPHILPFLCYKSAKTSYIDLGSCHKELNRGGRKGFQNSPQDYVAQCKTQKLFT